MIRKTFSVILATLVLFFTVICILAIWDIIDIERVFQKSMATLFVLFIASAIMLFIFAVVYKNEGKPKLNEKARPTPVSE